MAKKRSDKATLEAPAGTATPQPPGGNGAPQASRAPAPKNKTEAINWVLATGITSPKEVAEQVKKAYGLDVTQNHVSTIKGGMNTKKPSTGKKQGKPGRKPGSKPKQAPAA